MSYLDKVTVGSTTYDIQDTAAQGDIVDLKSAVSPLLYDVSIDFETVHTRNGVVASTGKWNGTNGKSCQIVVTQGMKSVTVTANSLNAAVIAFLANATLVHGELVQYTSTLGREIITADETETFKIPDDCVMINIQVISASNVDNTPDSVVFHNVIIQAAEEESVQARFDQAAYDYLNTGHDILSAYSNIMCCGDSLTLSSVYTGMDGSTHITREAYRKYPEILAAKTGATVTYKATGGYHAKDWWDAYNQYIVQKTNQLAIIYLGTNGMLTDTLDTDAPGTDVANYDKTTNTGAYAAIVKSFIDVGARVLLVHVCGLVENYAARNAVIDKIGERFGAAVVDVPYLADDKYHFWPDATNKNGIHYNDLGYAAWTESLIRNVGALPTNMMKRIIPI